MRKIILVAVAAIAAVAVIPATASARTHIGCGTAHGVKPRVAPRNCDTWYPWLSHAESAGYLTKLHWRHWGTQRATSRTTVQWHGFESFPARVVAYRPRSLFGDRSTRAYTRLFIETRYGASTMRLPWGYDLWPLY